MISNNSRTNRRIPSGNPVLNRAGMSAAARTPAGAIVPAERLTGATGHSHTRDTYQGRNHQLQTAYNPSYATFPQKCVKPSRSGAKRTYSDGYGHPSGRKAAAVRFAVTDAISISKFRSSHKYFLPPPLTSVNSHACDSLSTHRRARGSPRLQRNDRRRGDFASAYTKQSPASAAHGQKEECHDCIYTVPRTHKK